VCVAEGTNSGIFVVQRLSRCYPGVVWVFFPLYILTVYEGGQTDRS